MNTLLCRRTTLALLALALIYLAPEPAFGAYYANLGAARKTEHVENAPGAPSLSVGRISFRTKNKKTGSVFSLYTSDMSPSSARLEAERDLENGGWSKVLSLGALTVFSKGKSQCAVVQTILSKDGTTLVSVLSESR